MDLNVCSACELGGGLVPLVDPPVEITSDANQNLALACEKRTALPKRRSPVVSVVGDCLVLDGNFHVRVGVVASVARDPIDAITTLLVRSINGIKNVLTITVREKVLATLGNVRVVAVVLKVVSTD